MAHSNLPRPASLSRFAVLSIPCRPSPMAPLRTLVVGTGTVGGSILRAIASPDFRGRLSGAALIRPSSLLDAAKAAKIRSLELLGVEVVSGDCDDPTAELAERLRGFHTVISAVGGSGFKQSQLNLLEACKQAGVQRFIPSEFSVDTEAAGEGHALARLYREKRYIAEALKASELDYLQVVPGLFGELLLSPFGGVDIANLVVTAPYSFDTRVTFTAKPDIGRITAALLLSDVHRSRVRISGDTMSYGQIADTIERLTGKSVQRKVWTAKEIDAAIAESGEAGSVRAELAKFLGEGRAAWWEPTSAWNGQPEHRVTAQTGVQLLEALCFQRAA